MRKLLDNLFAFYRQHRYILTVGSGLVLVLILTFAGNSSVRFTQDGYWTNIYTEVLSILVTILVIDTLAQRRDAENRKRQLKREMNSSDNAIVRLAIRELRDNNWWEDGSLRGIELSNSNLEQTNLNHGCLVEAKLNHSNLKGATLHRTRLVRADLGSADLSSSELWETDLQYANLTAANLQSAKLQKANLQYAQLISADLAMADLSGTKLEYADLSRGSLAGAVIDGSTRFNEYTRLPDGKYWTSDTDVYQYTGNV